MKSFGKLFVFFAIFSLFSSMTFAAPGAGRDGDRGRGRERPGNQRSSREKDSPAANHSPSFSRSSQESRSPSSRSQRDKREDKTNPGESMKSEQERNEPQKNSPTDSRVESENPDKALANFSPDEKSDSKPAFSSPDESQTANGFNASANYSQSQQKQSSIIFYRGTRTLSDGEQFTIQNVKSQRTTNGEMVLELTFNQSINPRSFNASSILLNGEKLSSRIKFTFNKKGDTIKVAVPAKDDNISLIIQDVESFDGTKIEPMEVNIGKD